MPGYPSEERPGLGDGTQLGLDLRPHPVKVDTWNLGVLGLDRQCQCRVGWKGRFTGVVHAWSFPTPDDGIT